MREMQLSVSADLLGSGLRSMGFVIVLYLIFGGKKILEGAERPLQMDLYKQNFFCMRA
jgi:hypothetical protein